MLLREKVGGCWWLGEPQLTDDGDFLLSLFSNFKPDEEVQAAKRFECCTLR
jgi:hypothetical protein